MAFGDNLKKLRESRGLSTIDLAEIVGVGQPQVSRYESGERVPNVILAYEIAVALGTTVEQLVKGGTDHGRTETDDSENQ